jgi:sec-independent protein translocase protein TatC
MLLTPPDVFSQTLLAVPMWILFEVGLLGGSLVKRNREETESDSDNPSGDQPPAPLQ